jgi:hypothetical protein
MKVRKRLKRFMVNHSKKNAVMLLSVLSKYECVIKAIGKRSQKHGNIVHTVFIVYPETRKFQEAFVYSWFAKFIKFSPVIVGLFAENGKLGITWAVSATRNDLDATHLANLENVNAKMEKAKSNLQAKFYTRAGSLPSIMKSNGVKEDFTESDTTVDAVYDSVLQVVKEESMPADTNIVIMGGNGFIGKRFTEKLIREDWAGSVFLLDVDNKSDLNLLAQTVADQATIFLNVTRRGAIDDEYARSIKKFKKRAFLNEVFGITKEEILTIKESGTPFYNIVGGRGSNLLEILIQLLGLKSLLEKFPILKKFLKMNISSIPPFPHEYEGGIPCCALTPDVKHEIIVKKL